MSTELPVATRHRCDMTEKLLKASVKLEQTNKQTNKHNHAPDNIVYGQIMYIFNIYIYKKKKKKNTQKGFAFDHIVTAFKTIQSHATKKLGVYPLNRLSVHPSDSASFPDPNRSSFLTDFLQTLHDIDIREEWFGIASGLNSFINNKFMDLD